MAAKYLPGSTTATSQTEAPNVKKSGEAEKTATPKAQFVAFTPTRRNIVSALYREPSDSAFLADWSQIKNRGFYTAGSSEQVVQPKNSIRAIVGNNSKRDPHPPI